MPCCFPTCRSITYCLVDGDEVVPIPRLVQIEDYLGMSRVMGFTMIVAAVDVVLVTVIGTLGAFLYNLAAALLGGIELVLAEDER